MAVRQMLVAGRYKLLEPVGAGGMGRVWLARDQMLDREVAIKEIVPPDWMSEAEKDRLHSRTLREARSAARLTHPHVVRVYDVIHAEGLSWIVMEYVASRSLYQVLTTKGPYPPDEAARIGLAVLDALTAAHRAGVLHRDVKPHNVLIASDGRVLLTDFGLATFVDDGMVTTPGLIVGSPQYVSPERARDGASTVEADLWSFGATLYATVEGQSPYARDSAMATLAALATEPPDPPVRAGPLGPTLQGLLRYEPGQRLSAEEAERQLRAVAGEAPVRPRGGAEQGRSPAGSEAGTEVIPAGEPPRAAATGEAAPVEAARGVARVGAPRLDDDALTEPHQPSERSGDPVGTGDLSVTGLVAASKSDEISPACQPGAPDSGPSEDPGDSDGWWLPAARRRSELSAPLAPDRIAEALASGGSPEPFEPGRTSRAAAGDIAGSGYIDGTFTSSDPVPAAVGRAHQGSGNYRDRGEPGGNQAAAASESSRSRPNRQPVAAGDPASSPSLRRGNQAPPRAIPAPRSPVSGPLTSNQALPRRRSSRIRSAIRARLVVAALLAIVVLSGSLLGLHLAGQDDSAPQVVPPPVPSPSASSARASPGRPSARSSRVTRASPQTAGFSPVVCDARPPDRAPVAPKENAARGVNGWTLQAGWSYFTDRNGFHIPVPDGWTYHRIGTTYCFRDPRGTRVLSLDVGRPAATEPIDGCRAEDRRLRQARRVRDYQLIAIDPVELLHDAADWDFRYRTAAGALRRSSTRWFASSGRPYALGWATPEAAWATELGKLQMVRGTFYTDGFTATASPGG